MKDIQAGAVTATEEERILVSQFMDLDYPIEIDWNRLMPVVEKIENKGYKFDIIGSYHMGRRHKIRINGVGKGDASIEINDEGKTKIEAVCIAVVQFIQWHNLQPKTDKP